ncbi:MAG: M48 family metallopeptidase, partial [Proteobacteria bacterium]|nr:M48 family metallopeptidase [Pseudomonadota bacterium]
MLKLIQHILESSLSRLNARYWSDTNRQEMARTELGISSEDMNKSAAYSAVRYKFSRIRNSFTFLCFILFIGLKGIFYCEQFARNWGQKILGLNSGSEEILVGILFFAILMIGSQALSLPFSLYNTFVIEEKFGFNKQTIGGYLIDLAKATILGVVIGVPLLGTILWIMGATGDLWWIWAWLFISIFSIITSWLYPTLLAPLFNKFRPLEDGELKDKINSLASKIGFSTDGIFVMDASKRSAHGNAYFTGIFGKKRIVLFDTLLADMSAQEVTAVLAHELGHFKLHHVRYGLIRGLLMSLATFYLMSLVLNHSIFYEAFGLETITHHTGLVLFTLWFSTVEFFI